MSKPGIPASRYQRVKVTGESSGRGIFDFRFSIFDWGREKDFTEAKRTKGREHGCRLELTGVWTGRRNEKPRVAKNGERKSAKCNLKSEGANF
jgi:hypothetical protein